MQCYWYIDSALLVALFNIIHKNKETVKIAQVHICILTGIIPKETVFCFIWKYKYTSPTPPEFGGLVNMGHGTHPGLRKLQHCSSYHVAYWYYGVLLNAH